MRHQDRWSLGIVVALLTLAGGTAYAGGGNSGAAHACQNGGWMNWVRADGTAFKNLGDCVSYAAQGGVLTSPSTPVLTCGTVISTPGQYVLTANLDCSSIVTNLYPGIDIE